MVRRNIGYLALGVWFGVLVGVGLGGQMQRGREARRAGDASMPEHIWLAVPVNWHPEPVKLAVTKVEGMGEVVEFPENERTGPVWQVQVGTVTYSGVRE